MKTFLVVLAVLVFAILVGYLTFSLVKGEEVPAGSTDDLLNANRMKEASKMVQYLLWSMITAAVLGTLFVIFVLPKISLYVANVIYDQTPQENIIPSHIEAARSYKLQGEFEKAIEELEAAIEEDEPDRLAWVEMAQIQQQEFEDVEAAKLTLEEGWKSHQWEMDDDVNFITRLAEMELEHFNDRSAAVDLYKEVLDRYEENEYHANRARAALMELGVVV